MVLGSQYEALGSKETFNASVRHIKAAIALAERVNNGENLADGINNLLDEKTVQQDDIVSLVSMLLIDKFGYRSVSKNLTAMASDLGVVTNSVAPWNAFDLVAVYNHPDTGIVVVNPKNPLHVSRIDRLNKTELLVVYVGCNGKSFDSQLADEAARMLIAVYEGETPKAVSAFTKGSCSYKLPRESKTAAPKPTKMPKAKKTAKAKARTVSVPKSVAKSSKVSNQASASDRMPEPKIGSRMTPRYGVTVRNELFHNGNVEAWKRIIKSYNIKHPDLAVLVYYDGERIVDINALFKWGKVKHGSVIEFAVAGENISDVAKLQRYLAQGASPMFEAFLRGPINGVLSLF